MISATIAAARRDIDHMVQTYVVGWPPIDQLRFKQAAGWEVPRYTADLNEATELYAAVKAKGPALYKRFNRRLPRGRPPTAFEISMAALNALGPTPWAPENQPS